MDLSLATLSNLVIHLVGNKNNEQKLNLSDFPLKVTEELGNHLEPFFLAKFPNVFERLRFSHSSSLEFNEVYQYVRQAFQGDMTLLEASQHIASHLYEVTTHPNIKSGELYVCHFNHCTIHNQSTDSIGIFKTELRNGYFDVHHSNTEIELSYHEGIDVKKFDKGCLIFNTNADDGYEVCVIDNQNRGEEALYWKENFLGLKSIKNDFLQTNQFLGMTKSFVTEQFQDEFNVNRTDQIDILNRSVDYFKGHESFDKQEFEQEVLQDKNVIQSFRNYGNEYMEQNHIDLEDSFEISHQAVKKQSRVFKSVLKLDKNFHVYIHGDKSLIEQGVDDNGRKFYKIYYDQES